MIDSDSMIHWFGPEDWHLLQPWPDALPRQPIPVGECCFRCGLAIAADDFGFTMLHQDRHTWTRRAWHRHCFTDAITM